MHRGTAVLVSDVLFITHKASGMPLQHSKILAAKLADEIDADLDAARDRTKRHDELPAMS
jgi:hypothetical protein